MLNVTEPQTLPQVIDYADPHVAERMANGRINTAPAQILGNIASAIRRGHPQMRTGPVRPERICLVGSGPSLAETEPELRDLLWDGAVLVTLNGAYHWAIERNLKPQTQIVMDARPSNARFLQPYVPKCNYVLASQCAPETWDAVAAYPDTWIFHAVVKGVEDASPLLDAYYGGNWIGVPGGTTVATRALSLLRMAGYVRFHLFGVDCCWTGTEHHAMPQPENAHDQRVRVTAGLPDRPETAREFIVSPWMLKQAEDALTMLAVNGQHFQVAVHGDGLLAYVLHTLGGGHDLTFTPQQTTEE
jgi:hypothetical protein